MLQVFYNKRQLAGDKKISFSIIRDGDELEVDCDHMLKKVRPSEKLIMKEGPKNDESDWDIESSAESEHRKFRVEQKLISHKSDLLALSDQDGHPGIRFVL